MKFLIKVFLLTLLVSPNAYSELNTSYFQLGDWKIGEKKADLLSGESQFFDIKEIVKKKKYSAKVDTIFSQNTPVRLFFKRKKLNRLELTIYEGSNHDEAIKTVKSVIAVLEAKFDGASLGGLTTSEGLEPDVVDVVVGQLLEKSKQIIDDINKEESDQDQAFFNFFVDITTEYQSKGNFIYVKFSFLGDSDSYNVTVYEDKKFNKNHVEPTMIFIGSKTKN